MGSIVEYAWGCGDHDRVSAGGYVYTSSSDAAYSCFCRGPQNGQPLCPCAMRDVTIRDGRYVQIIDLGPVKGAKS